MILNYLCIFLFFFRLLDRRLQSSKVNRSCGVDKKVHFFSECTRCELKHIISFWCVIYHFGVVFLLIIILLAMVFNVWGRIALTDPSEYQLLRMHAHVPKIHTCTDTYYIYALLINQDS